MSTEITERVVEVEVPINIALIKYWGKKDEDLIIPVNNSVSLNIDDVFARTRVRCLWNGTTDSVSINNVVVDLKRSKRFLRCFDYARLLIRRRSMSYNNSHSVTGTQYSFQVSSTTNFPVGAGLASSAAGFAAIALAIGVMFDFTMSEVSALARIGSGSACRSVFGGLVEWNSGVEPSGIDSISKQLLPEGSWPDLRAVIIVLDESEKEIGSSEGMRRSVNTSELLSHRAEVIVPNRIKRLHEAFKAHDFAEFARITMLDSNQLHAICLDTLPPLKYMSDASWLVIHAVNEFNSRGQIRAAYTFDAGPNACVFIRHDDVPSFLLQLSDYLVIPRELPSVLEYVGCISQSATKRKPMSTFVVKNIVISRVGGSPKVLS
ncbi:hypothetical protein KIN20_014334 [Parelaphostrongylus tenuis]|uniref:Diphosphomevalonate decarboxylase n=1 Tax=Parelaphostrongylus tenuis TaxID=148309 RepID=A0AAD5MVY3_PARTN|nr:hypothetical protein KIN20_014334 [Parelaphostrongylus tenuis]